MNKYYYTIGEVSKLLGEKAYVIRYWESEFKFLRPRKEDGRIRRYTQDNIDLLKQIQDMLHNQKFTIEGARQKLKALRNPARREDPPPTARKENEATEISRQAMAELRDSLRAIRDKCRLLLKDNK